MGGRLRRDTSRLVCVYESLVQNGAFVDVEHARSAARSGACAQQELQATQNHGDALRKWVRLRA